MTLTPRNTGWIEVICGPMFSGKTEELIRRLVRAQIAKQKVAIFKPNTDNRFSNNYIVSHNQRKINSIQVKKTNRILDYQDSVEALSVEIIQSAAKKYLNTENYVKVILYPEEVE